MSESCLPPPLPEFVPSVLKPTLEERVAARTAWHKLVQAGQKFDNLPQEFKDIVVRDSVVSEERSAYNRDSTKIIAERVLDPDKPITIEDIYTLLHVYYWWNENWQHPVNYLEDVLKDLSPERLQEAIHVLHSEFRELCTTNEVSKCRRKDGYKCFLKWRSSEDGHFYADSDSDAEIISFWLIELDQDDKDEDAESESYSSSLFNRVGEFAVSRLLEAGADDIEAQDAMNVLERTAEYRSLDRMQDYFEYRETGGAPQNALFDFFAIKMADDPESFRNVIEQYEGLTDEALQWGRERKVALAKRYVTSQADYFLQFEESYQQYTHGVQPFYIRRFAEEYFPQDLRC